jgi:uncharacterized membrane protein YdjX (TVP38/TMEM64 family)
MKEALLELFHQHPQAAIFLSLLASILIALAGVLPSFFVTAANILFFGFWPGTLISFLGEALGAVAAFILYRKGLKKTIDQQLKRFPKAMKLVEAENREAFFLILSLRLIPFVPSGLVTFAAAVGRVSLLTFIISSSLGKAPALLLEAYSVNQVTRFTLAGKLILLALAIGLLWYAIKKAKTAKP